MQKGKNLTFQLVDASGHLLAFKRMDGVLLGAIDIAIRKVKTSALFQKPFHILGKISSGRLYQIEHSNGVSGSTIENDSAMAQAGIES